MGVELFDRLKIDKIIRNELRLKTERSHDLPEKIYNSQHNSLKSKRKKIESNNFLLINYSYVLYFFNCFPNLT